MPEHDVWRFVTLLGLYLLVTPSNIRSEDTPNLDLRIAVIEFERQHDPFVRSLFGCPIKGEVNNDTCTPALGIVDYGRFLAAQKKAAKLYHLQVPK